MKEQNAVIIATALLLKKQKENATRENEKEREQVEKKERERIAAIDEQKRRDLLKKTSTVNPFTLRATWDKMISQPFLKKEAARLAAKNAKPAKKAPVKKTMSASSKLSPAISAELLKMDLCPQTVEGKTLSQKIETAKRIISIREKMKKDKIV